jgi:phage virion morphogenesis protein
MSRDVLTLTVDDSEVMDYLNQLRAKLDDLTPVYDAIGQRLVEHISMRFENEADPSGTPWKSLSPATWATYPENGNRRILDRYGDMLKSLNHQADASAVTVGFGVPYAAYHEFGTNKMPRRGLLFADPVSRTLADDDRETILDILDEYLTS